MTDSTQLNLENLSFREAIAFTQIWLQQIEAGSLDDEQILADMTKILSQPNGVRGFFVAYLTGESPLADYPPAIFFDGFRVIASSVSGILVKNLAMSTAMAIAHKRNHDPEQQASSETVQRRSAQLLQKLGEKDGQNPFDQERLSLLKAIQTQEGEYANFLQRWGYDDEQCQTIRVALESIN